MKTRTVLEEQFRRARHDIDFRAHMMENATYSRSLNGWAAVVFAVLATSQTIYEVVRGGAWVNPTPGFCAVGCAIAVLAYNKAGERIAMLGSMGDLPNQSSEPALSSVTPPAGQESRPR
jgi:hypothetical protein